jgi:hypothetical protein
MKNDNCKLLSFIVGSLGLLAILGMSRNHYPSPAKFVMLRVDSWIVAFATTIETIHESTRNITKTHLQFQRAEGLT